MENLSEKYQTVQLTLLNSESNLNLCDQPQIQPLKRIVQLLNKNRLLTVPSYPMENNWNYAPERIFLALS